MLNVRVLALISTVSLAACAGDSTSDFDLSDGDTGPAPVTLEEEELDRQRAELAAQLPPAPPVTLAPAAGPLVRRNIRVNGVAREFLLHVPASLEQATPAPLVMIHHGFTMSAMVMANLTSWRAIAEREKIIVAFPNGDMDFGPISSPWNVGLGVCGVGAFVANPIQDDLGFVDAMIADVNAIHPVDKQNVFTTGFSMGGYFANHIGCQRSKLLKAVAPHSGGTYGGDCPSYEPLPVMLVHGTGDGLIAYDCGKQAKDHWVRRNGCSPNNPRTQPVKGGTCEFYQGCKPGADVAMCTFQGMGHGWAGSAGFGLPFDYAGGVRFEDGAEVIWRFFKQYI